MKRGIQYRPINIILRLIILPIFLSLVCSNNETMSGFLKRLLGNVAKPSISDTPFMNDLPEAAILNLSSKSTKSITENSLSSSNSLKIVPRTCKKIKQKKSITYRAIQIQVVKYFQKNIGYYRHRWINVQQEEGNENFSKCKKYKSFS